MSWYTPLDRRGLRNLRKVFGPKCSCKCNAPYTYLLYYPNIMLSDRRIAFLTSRFAGISFYLVEIFCRFWVWRLFDHIKSLLDFCLFRGTAYKRNSLRNCARNRELESCLLTKFLPFLSHLCRWLLSLSARFCHFILHYIGWIVFCVGE